MVQSAELTDKRKQQINDFIITFRAEKITYNGIQGYFIPHYGWQQVEKTLLSYIVEQEMSQEKDKRIDELRYLETVNFRLKTGLGISISFNVGLTIAAIGTCFFVAAFKN